MSLVRLMGRMTMHATKEAKTKISQLMRRNFMYRAASMPALAMICASVALTTEGIHPRKDSGSFGGAEYPSSVT